MATSDDLIKSVGANIQEKASLIWSVADTLRGPYKPHEYGLVILPMTVIKRFHDCLLPTHQKVLDTAQQVKTLCKWYTYITQVVRMFDRDLHKEYVYLSYLRHLLKAEKIPVDAVDDKVEMRFYKLKREFEGSISLKGGNGELEPAKGGGDAVLDKKRDPLQALVDKFNEQWAGNFTDGDRVVIDTLWKRIADNPEVKDTIQRDGRRVFESSVLPKVFDEEARRAYMENTNSFTSLFEDGAKYRAMMNAIGQLLVEKFG